MMLNVAAAPEPDSRLRLAITGRSIGCALAAAAISLAIDLPDPMLGGDLWIWLGIVDLVLMHQLVRMYLRTGPVLCALFFLFTYYLAPVPFLAFELPIVPYATNVSIADFVRTWLVMSAFLAWLATFSSLSATTERAAPVAFGARIHEQGIGVLASLFWLGVAPFMAFEFKGASVANVSGADNWDAYLENLQGQSGALEYFLIAIVIGRMISRSPVHKVCYWLCVGYYVYFCGTRGYRVQLMEALALVATLNFPDRLTLRVVVLGSVAGFLAFQALGFMKTGASDLGSLFTVMAGEEIRSNQTEVFYTSNGVIHAVSAGLIPIADRMQSLALAALATFLPGGLLPATWQTTLATASIVSIEGGGGGFIAGHYYFWAGAAGIVASALLVTALFRFYERARGQRAVLLATLVLATFPRWIAYEPVAMFFRLGIYFVVAYELIHLLQRLSMPRWQAQPE